MKELGLIIVFLSNLSLAYCQDNDGHLCGHEDEKQLWILRFEIIDSETHLPVRNAIIEISGNNGNDITWDASARGTSVLVVTSEYCIPTQGKLEIKARNYNYYQANIYRRFFQEEEDNNRIYIDGKYNFDGIPETQELMDIVTAKRYRKGVKNIQIMGGVNVKNNSPACFEYEIELEKIKDNYYPQERNTYSKSGNDYNRSSSDQLSSVMLNGEKIYVFPNDLSSGPYNLEQAISACNSLNLLGYDDWYLPSKEELNILYLNKDKIGGFSGGWYWSSTPSTGSSYWGQSFGNGVQNIEFRGTTYKINKGNMKVRCIRKD